MERKKLIIINGVPGVGKTTTCRLLLKELASAVWLDGDWCWMMNPFVVNEENKQMVEKNITYLLRNFLTNSNLQHVIFNWVIHREVIFDLILEPLGDLEFELHKISLICSPESLEKRMLDDKRELRQIKDSKQEVELYQQMDTVKVDTTDRKVEDIVEEICKIVQG